MILNITRLVLYIILVVLGYFGQINPWIAPLLFLYDWNWYIYIPIGKSQVSKSLIPLYKNPPGDIGPSIYPKGEIWN